MARYTDKHKKKTVSSLSSPPKDGVQKSGGFSSKTSPQPVLSHDLPPDSLNKTDLLQLQQSIGNHALQKLLSDSAIQRAPLTVEERALDLQADRFASNDKLQKAYDNSPPIKKGASGEEVIILQQALFELGYRFTTSMEETHTPDGKFGRETKSIVKQFQKDMGIKDDGVVGRDTMGELDRLFSAKPSQPVPQPAGDDTQAYIDHLRKSGKIEGKAESPTKAADVVSKNLFQAESHAFRLLLIKELVVDQSLRDSILAILSVEAGADLTSVAKDPDFSEEQLDFLYKIFPAFNSFAPRGAPESDTWNVEDFIDHWEKENGREMTADERATLARGCIGITALNLGPNGLPNPDLTQSYDTFEQAYDVMKKWNEALKSQGFTDRKAVIFSKRFWSDGKEYKPDEHTGQVDMSDYDYKARPGFVNFDYGYYDENTGKWWHANHADPGMKIYESDIQHYSRDLLDFDKQVFNVAVSNLQSTL